MGRGGKYLSAPSEMIRVVNLWLRQCLAIPAIDFRLNFIRKNDLQFKTPEYTSGRHGRCFATRGDPRIGTFLNRCSPYWLE
jgi:hypothetical protein